MKWDQACKHAFMKIRRYNVVWGGHLGLISSYFHPVEFLNCFDLSLLVPHSFLIVF